MTEHDGARRVVLALTTAQSAEPQAALAILNEMVELARRSWGEQSLEIEEARSSAFVAICEVGKALHRGQPAPPPWVAAIAATEGGWH
ncbi:hypothetical protein [Bradyrhizobium sp. WD16]|uniref:hypothetical protein n=1 Tax=Bradyrhizobium sp. WD16 TaxID=1521768 RepID=UPI0035322E30